MSEAFTYVGKSLPRLDGREKVTGAAHYTADLVLPRMLHGWLLRSPYPHARIKRIDSSKAEAFPGVMAVLHHDNVLERVYPPETRPAEQTRFSFSAFDVTNPPPGTLGHSGKYQAVREQVLFPNEVTHVGDVVAAVAAETAEAAEQALALIEVEYEELPAVFDSEEALTDRVLVNTWLKTNVVRVVEVKVGPVEEMLSQAAMTVSGRFRTQKQKQCQLERTCALADVDTAGKITLHAPTQMPHAVRRILADVFRLPMSKVRVVTPNIGGAFGKNIGMSAEPYTVALALAARRPVQVVYQRDEDFIGSESRHPVIMDITLAFAADGTLLCIKANSLLDAGGYATQSGEVTQVHGGYLIRLYKSKSIHYQGTAVLTNTPVSGGYRGYGAPQALFALEQLIDIAAAKLGMDAMELRRKIALKVGDIDPPTRRPVVCSGLEECMDRGAASIGWAQKRGKGRQGRRRRGIGMVIEVSISGTGGLAGFQEKGTAIVKLTEDGSVNITCGATDLGTGVKTAIAQICAELLQVPPDKIDVSFGDTDASPFDIGSHGNRTLFVPGLAVREAALELCKKLTDYAAKMLECDPAKVVLKDGRLHVGSDRSLSISEVVNHGHFNNLEFIAVGVAPVANAAGFGAQFAEVEVDTETGEVQVLRVVSAQDVGRAINPMIVAGQIEGGVFHGLAQALAEEMVVDRQTGQPLNPNFMDYKFLTAADVPNFEAILVQPVDPNGPFGVKGVAQNSTSMAPAAIANAVADAIGAHIHELPITPERVLAALRAAKS